MKLKILSLIAFITSCFLAATNIIIAVLVKSWHLVGISIVPSFNGAMAWFVVYLLERYGKKEEE